MTRLESIEIMAVVDTSTSLQLLSELLGNAGYKVRSVNDG